MTDLFSSNESSSLAREVELGPEETSYDLSVIWNLERLAECRQWIEDNNYKKVLSECSQNINRN